MLVVVVAELRCWSGSDNGIGGEVGDGKELTIVIVK